ncbi:hypothetical protein [Actinomadura kijaniata]|uniref:hypothetical protein n=1 Tax=Actinomadura kijaniata TaxID=46161 RepID=UPI000837144D|nr:hypothetical protein [Actinomadura kijaniata]
MDDPEHARLRRMVNGAFTARRVATMRPAVERMVDRVRVGRLTRHEAAAMGVLLLLRHLDQLARVRDTRHQAFGVSTRHCLGGRRAVRRPLHVRRGDLRGPRADGHLVTAAPWRGRPSAVVR